MSWRVSLAVSQNLVCCPLKTAVLGIIVSKNWCSALARTFFNVPVMPKMLSRWAAHFVLDRH